MSNDLKHETKQAIVAKVIHEFKYDSSPLENWPKQ